MILKLFRALFETRDGEHEYPSYRYVAAPNLDEAHRWAMYQLYTWFGVGATHKYADSINTVEGPGAEYRLVTYKGVDQMTSGCVVGTDGKKYRFEYTLIQEPVP